MKRFSVVFLSLLFSFSVVKSQVILKSGKDYIFGDRIVVKFKNATLAKSALTNTTLSKALKSFGITSIEKRFKLRERLDKNSGGGLENIMTLKYSSPINPIYLSRKISKLPGVEWAEPYYLSQIMYVPNDPRYGEQWWMRVIKAPQAWDVTKGDTSIVIGIVDTGVDWNHSDLAANIWTNWGEIPNNGIDDDNNGYIDDVHGWDFGGLAGTPDNDPHEDEPDHGTHVAGIASAVTDNGIGIASIGFKCKIMPVKTSRNDFRDNYGNPFIVYGYQGIIYAVENGAKVINISWGSYSYSNAEKEVIDYAVAHGVLVVGAAGNETNPESIYPGAYKGALSVGAVGSQDKIAYFSNYGKRVDVFAPGVSILSTWQHDSYTDALSGTSMAAPFVAGLAGLVFSQFPNYSPQQVAQQIRVTADDIYSKNDVSYSYLLGHGRINAYAAVSTDSAKAVRIEKTDFVDESNGNGVLEPNEKVGIKIKFKNILNATSSLKIKLVSKSECAQVQNGDLDVGSIGEGEEFDNYSQEFLIKLSSNVPQNYEVPLLLKYSDNGYDDFEWVSVLVNPTYMTQSVNNITLTFTSKGTLGYNDYPNNSQGDGFEYKDSQNLLFEGALMYGTSSTMLDDAARDVSGNRQDNDFTMVKPFTLNSPGSLADVQGQTIFNDFNATGTSLKIKTTMNTFSFADKDKSNFIIVQYIFENSTAEDITNFRCGLFMDWDIDGNTYDDNVVDFDTQGGFGYAYSSSKKMTDAYLGCALISKGTYNFYAIQNDGKDGGINVYDGFSDSEKWLTLSNGTTKSKAGPQDISYVAGAGPYTIHANHSITVAFAIAGAESVDSLRIAVEAAKAIYDSTLTEVKNEGGKGMPHKFALLQNYPNPFGGAVSAGNPSTVIKYQLAKPSPVKLSVYDILGRKVRTLFSGFQTSGYHSVNFNSLNLSSGVYFYKLKAGNFTAIKKMILLR